MAVASPPGTVDVAANPAGALAFTGGLDYGPNLQALRWYVREVAPVLRTALPDARLDVYGHCPEAVRPELAHPSTRLHGYVDDLYGELRSHRAFVAPITEGSGIKTKILEAMALGLPVVTTPIGAEGMRVEHGRHLLIGDTPAALARWIVHLAEHPAEGARMAAAARTLVERDYAPLVITARWDALVREIAAAAPPPEHMVLTARLALAS